MVVGYFGTKFTTNIEKSIIFVTFVIGKVFLKEEKMMNYLNALLDSLVGFVRRNPILVLVIVLLAFTAPAVLRGLATLILYIVLGFVILALVLMIALRWRIHKVQQQMRDQFNRQQQSTHNPFGQGFNPFGQQQQQQRQQQSRQDEGEVTVHKTTATPEKRISKDVGDYVEFEETKE